MENEAQAALRGLDDLTNRIDTCVGQLTTLRDQLERGVIAGSAVRSLNDAMLMLAGLHDLATWQPPPEMKRADQLRAMADVGPRPAATVAMLRDAAHLLSGRVPHDGPVVAHVINVGDLLDVERHAGDLARVALDLQSRIGKLGR